MSPNSPVWRANVARLAPLAGATPATALPLTMFGSMRAAARRIRARMPTLAEPVVDHTAYDIPLNTPVAAPPPAPTITGGVVGVDAFPTAVAVNPKDGQVYVVNTGNDSVSIIDADTKVATVTIAVGSTPYGIALTPDGRTAYVANAGDNSVSVIDTQEPRVTDTIAVGENPYGVAVAPDGERVYVTNQSGGSLTVIGAVRSTIPVGGAPTGVAISPDGKRAYVVDNEAHSLIVVDTHAGTSAGIIPVGKYPAQVAITPDGAQAFVTNAGGGSVSVVDLSSTAVTETLMVSDHPIGVAVGADGRFAYVTALDASLLAGTLTIIEIATGAMKTLHAGAPCGVAPDPAADRVYITDFRSQTLSVIAAGDEPDEVGPNRNGKPLTARRRPPPEDTAPSIPIDRGVLSVVADPDNGRAFVVRSEDDAIEVIDSTGHSATVNVGRYPTALVLTGDGTRAYVTNYEDCSLSVIDTAPDSDSAYAVAATLDLGPTWSSGVVLSGDGSRAYAVDEMDGHLSVIDVVTDSRSRDTVIAHVELRDPPTALLIAPNRRWVYAINHFDHVLWAVHTVTNRTAAIKLPAYPYRIYSSPNGLRLYASLCGDGSTCVIDTDPGSAGYHRIIARLRLADYGPDPVFTTAGGHAYVVNSDTDSVSAIDTATSTVKNIAVGRYPWDVAVSPDGRRAYIVNNLDDSLSILATATDSVTATVPVGVRPCRVAVTPDGARAFVVNNRDDTVSVIDSETSTVSSTIAVGHKPFDVSVSSDGGRALVRHRDGLSLVTA